MCIAQNKPEVEDSSFAFQVLENAVGTENASSLVSFFAPNPNQDVKKTTESQSSNKDTTLPWYRRGGLHLTLNFMALNIFIPMAFLASQLPGDQCKQFVQLAAFCCASAAIGGSRTIYCIVVTPCYMLSLLLCSHLNHSLLLLAISLVISIAKVNICMSVCLHRYAAHAAFKCGPMTNLFMNALGCLANQGGPIWWASQHRCHHKYCDVPRDPHSALLDGTQAAYGFFEKHIEVVEEFAPRHLESAVLRVLDTYLVVVARLGRTIC